MEKTPHIQIFGEGAKWFALQNGFPLEMPHTIESIRDWYNGHPDKKTWPGKPKVKGVPIGADVMAEISEQNHDTVTVIGQGPDGGSTYLLPRLIGMRRAQELTLLNRRLSAEEAYAWQLLTRVVDDDALAIS